MAAKAPIALIHCKLGKAGNWRPFLEALNTPVSPLLIELPGHGLAPDWDESRDYSDQALELALDEMPSEPVPLIGHSFGASLALRLAVERPYRVSSLVLIEPVTHAAVKGRWAYDKLKRDMSAFEKKMKSAQYATAAKLFHELWNDTVAWEDLDTEQKSYVTDRVRLVPAGGPLVFEDLPNVLGEGRLETLDMPVTFIDGGNSHPIIAESIIAMGDRIPDAEWITVPHASHMLPMTHPGRVVEAIGDRLFVEKVWDA